MKRGIGCLLIGAMTCVAMAEDVLPEPEQVFVVTVATKDAAHPFFGKGSTIGMLVDGVPGKEVVLTRGKTYAFRVETDVKHDFYLSTAPKGWGASVFTDGVKGNFTYNGLVTIVTSESTPDTIYYACRNHKYMGGAIHVVKAGEEGKHAVQQGSTASATEEQAHDSAQVVVSEELVKQKISFAEMFINQSEAGQRIEASDNTQAKDMYHSAQKSLSDAQQGLTAGSLEAAFAAASEALRLMTESSRMVPSQAQKDEQKARYNELLEGVQTFEGSYTRNLERMQKQGKKEIKTLDSDQLHDMVKQAKRLADEGKYDEANGLLSKAQRMITTTLGAMLDSETVVYDKNFATPKEEYEYELARYKSYLELVPLAIEQKKPSKNAEELMDQFVEKAQGIFKLVGPEADKGDYPTAIQMLQGATSHLQRALQIAGVK